MSQPAFHNPTYLIEVPEPTTHNEDTSSAIYVLVKAYAYVFGALLLLTAITVGIWSLHLPRNLAIILAISVATIKVSLVVAFFMHLLFENSKPLFVVLALLSVIAMGLVLGSTLIDQETKDYVTSLGGKA